MTQTEDCLMRNRDLVTRFIHRRIMSIVRLLFEESDEPARLAWGAALVELDGDDSFLLECEESLSNLIVFAMPPGPGALRDAQQRKVVRPDVATRETSDPLSFVLEQRITAIDAISRAHDPEPGMRRYYEMCGWRIHFESKRPICVGTHLTESCFPSVAFYLPVEVDPGLRYARLA